MSGGDVDDVEGFRREFGRLYIQPEVLAREQVTRPARRVYVGGLPPSANKQSVATFFNQSMAAVGGNTGGPGDAVLDVYMNHECRFAFVEMRLVEEASNAMALDGILFEGAPLIIRRPADYNPSVAAALGPSMPNPHMNLAAVGLTVGSAKGLEGPGRIFDWQTGNSMGYAFCIYQDLSVTDIACATLNGIRFGSNTLTVRRANQGAAQFPAVQELQLQPHMNSIHMPVGALPTKVVCLTQVVTADELQDDEEYEDIMEDMRLEARSCGNLVKVVIPRPGPSGQSVAGVGKVFLEYADIDSAAKAKGMLHGRKFGENPVVAVYYSEDRFGNEEYN
ncbi:unnamed protein product [Urochloa humidicola]